MRIMIPTFVMAAAFMVSACAALAADASEDESAEKKSGTDSNFNLQVQRNDVKETNKRGKLFKGLTRTLMSPISDRTHESKRAGVSTEQTKALKGGAAAQSLAEFDLELIVDVSQSMRRKDCPGGISRWQWCGEELSSMSHELSPYVQHGFTLTTFASDYDVLKNATPEDVNERFAKQPSEAVTRLSLPLNSRFKFFFETRKSNSKPVLIVVITDGVPHPENEKQLVIDSLISASKRVSKNKELTVAFFQIGHENDEGKQFVKEIDNDLVDRGAPYDIVRSMPFEELEHIGLLNALVALVKDFAKVSEKSDQP